jgi:hypothetical protein
VLLATAPPQTSIATIRRLRCRGTEYRSATPITARLRADAGPRFEQVFAPVTHGRRGRRQPFGSCRRDVAVLSVRGSVGRSVASACLVEWTSSGRLR